MYKNSARFFAKHPKLVKALPGSKTVLKSNETPSTHIVVCDFCNSKIKAVNLKKHLKKSHPTKLQGEIKPISKGEKFASSEIAKNRSALSNVKTSKGKIRIYDLARELGIPSKQIIRDVRRFGIVIEVPSETVPQIIANKVRLIYTPETDTSKKHVPARLIRKQDFQSYSEEPKRFSPSDVCSEIQPSLPEDAEVLLLESKKAEWLNEEKICDNCQCVSKPSWKYSKSNKGLIHLCSRCKPIVYSKSFGKIDALDIAQQGGSFESNRRKH